MQRRDSINRITARDSSSYGLRIFYRDYLTKFIFPCMHYGIAVLDLNCDYFWDLIRDPHQRELLESFKNTPYQRSVAHWYDHMIRHMPVQLISYLKTHCFCSFAAPGIVSGQERVAVGDYKIF